MNYATPFAAAIAAGLLASLSGCGTVGRYPLRPLDKTDIRAVSPGQRITVPTNRPAYFLLSDEYLEEILLLRIEDA